MDAGWSVARPQRKNKRLSRISHGELRAFCWVTPAGQHEALAEAGWSRHSLPQSIEAIVAPKFGQPDDWQAVESARDFSWARFWSYDKDAGSFEIRRAPTDSDPAQVTLQIEETIRAIAARESVEVQILPGS